MPALDALDEAICAEIDGPHFVWHLPDAAGRVANPSAPLARHGHAVACAAAGLFYQRALAACGAGGDGLAMVLIGGGGGGAGGGGDGDGDGSGADDAAATAAAAEDAELMADAAEAAASAIPESWQHLQQPAGGARKRSRSASAGPLSPSAPSAPLLPRALAQPARWGPVLATFVRQHGHGLPLAFFRGAAAGVGRVLAAEAAQESGTVAAASAAGGAATAAAAPAAAHNAAAPIPPPPAPGGPSGGTRDVRLLWLLRIAAELVVAWPAPGPRAGVEDIWRRPDEEQQEAAAAATTTASGLGDDRALWRLIWASTSRLVRTLLLAEAVEAGPGRGRQQQPQAQPQQPTMQPPPPPPPPFHQPFQQPTQSLRPFAFTQQQHHHQPMTQQPMMMTQQHYYHATQHQGPTQQQQQRRLRAAAAAAPLVPPPAPAPLPLVRGGSLGSSAAAHAALCEAGLALLARMMERRFASPARHESLALAQTLADAYGGGAAGGGAAPLASAAAAATNTPPLPDAAFAVICALYPPCHPVCGRQDAGVRLRLLSACLSAARAGTGLLGKGPSGAAARGAALLAAVRALLGAPPLAAPEPVPNLAPGGAELMLPASVVAATAAGLDSGAGPVFLPPSDPLSPGGGGSGGGGAAAAASFPWWWSPAAAGDDPGTLRMEKLLLDCEPPEERLKRRLAAVRRQAEAAGGAGGGGHDPTSETPLEPSVPPAPALLLSEVLPRFYSWAAEATAEAARAMPLAHEDGLALAQALAGRGSPRGAAAAAPTPAAASVAAAAQAALVCACVAAAFSAELYWSERVVGGAGTAVALARGGGPGGGIGGAAGNNHNAAAAAALSQWSGDAIGGRGGERAAAAGAAAACLSAVCGHGGSSRSSRGVLPAVAREDPFAAETRLVPALALLASEAARVRRALEAAPLSSSVSAAVAADWSPLAAAFDAAPLAIESALAAANSATSAAITGPAEQSLMLGNGGSAGVGVGVGVGVGGPAAAGAPPGARGAGGRAAFAGSRHQTASDPFAMPEEVGGAAEGAGAEEEEEDFFAMPSAPRPRGVGVGVGGGAAARAAAGAPPGGAAAAATGAAASISAQPPPPSGLPDTPAAEVATLSALAALAPAAPRAVAAAARGLLSGCTLLPVPPSDELRHGAVTALVAAVADGGAWDLGGEAAAMLGPGDDSGSGGGAPEPQPGSPPPPDGSSQAERDFGGAAGAASRARRLGLMVGARIGHQSRVRHALALAERMCRGALAAAGAEGARGAMRLLELLPPPRAVEDADGAHRFGGATQRPAAGAGGRRRRLGQVDSRGLPLLPDQFERPGDVEPARAGGGGGGRSGRRHDGDEEEEGDDLPVYRDEYDFQEEDEEEQYAAAAAMAHGGGRHGGRRAAAGLAPEGDGGGPGSGGARGAVGTGPTALQGLITLVMTAEMQLESTINRHLHELGGSDDPADAAAIRGSVSPATRLALARTMAALAAAVPAAVDPWSWPRGAGRAPGALAIYSRELGTAAQAMVETLLASPHSALQLATGRLASALLLRPALLAQAAVAAAGDSPSAASIASGDSAASRLESLQPHLAGTSADALLHAAEVARERRREAAAAAAEAERQQRLQQQGAATAVPAAAAAAVAAAPGGWRRRGAVPAAAASAPAAAGLEEPAAKRARPAGEGEEGEEAAGEEGAAAAAAAPPPPPPPPPPPDDDADLPPPPSDDNVQRAIAAGKDSRAAAAALHVAEMMLCCELEAAGGAGAGGGSAAARAGASADLPGGDDPLEREAVACLASLAAYGAAQCGGPARARSPACAALALDALAACHGYASRAPYSRHHLPPLAWRWVAGRGAPLGLLAAVSRTTLAPEGEALEEQGQDGVDREWAEVTGGVAATTAGSSLSSSSTLAPFVAAIAPAVLLRDDVAELASLARLYGYESPADLLRASFAACFGTLWAWSRAPPASGRGGGGEGGGAGAGSLTSDAVRKALGGRCMAFLAKDEQAQLLKLRHESILTRLVLSAELEDPLAGGDGSAGAAAVAAGAAAAAAADAGTTPLPTVLAGGGGGSTASARPSAAAAAQPSPPCPPYLTPADAPGCSVSAAVAAAFSLVAPPAAPRPAGLDADAWRADNMYAAGALTRPRALSLVLAAVEHVECAAHPRHRLRRLGALEAAVRVCGGAQRVARDPALCRLLLHAALLRLLPRDPALQPALCAMLRRYVLAPLVVVAAPAAARASAAAAAAMLGAPSPARSPSSAAASLGVLGRALPDLLSALCAAVGGAERCRELEALSRVWGHGAAAVLTEAAEDAAALPPPPTLPLSAVASAASAAALELARARPLRPFLRRCPLPPVLVAADAPAAAAACPCPPTLAPVLVAVRDAGRLGGLAGALAALAARAERLPARERAAAVAALRAAVDRAEPHELFCVAADGGGSGAAAAASYHHHQASPLPLRRDVAAAAWAMAASGARAGDAALSALAAALLARAGPLLPAGASSDGASFDPPRLPAGTWTRPPFSGAELVARAVGTPSGRGDGPPFPTAGGVGGGAGGGSDGSAAPDVWTHEAADTAAACTHLAVSRAVLRAALEELAAGLLDRELVAARAAQAALRALLLQQRRAKEPSGDEGSAPSAAAARPSDEGRAAARALLREAGVAADAPAEFESVLRDEDDACVAAQQLVVATPAAAATPEGARGSDDGGGAATAAEDDEAGEAAAGWGGFASRAEGLVQRRHAAALIDALGAYLPALDADEEMEEEEKEDGGGGSGAAAAAGPSSSKRQRRLLERAACDAALWTPGGARSHDRWLCDLTSALLRACGSSSVGGAQEEQEGDTTDDDDDEGGNGASPSPSEPLLPWLPLLARAAAARPALAELLLPHALRELCTRDPSGLGERLSRAVRECVLEPAAAADGGAGGGAAPARDSLSHDDPDASGNGGLPPSAGLASSSFSSSSSSPYAAAAAALLRALEVLRGLHRTALVDARGSPPADARDPWHWRRPCCLPGVPPLLLARAALACRDPFVALVHADAWCEEAHGALAYAPPPRRPPGAAAFAAAAGGGGAAAAAAAGTDSMSDADEGDDDDAAAAAASAAAAANAALIFWGRDEQEEEAAAGLGGGGGGISIGAPAAAAPLPPGRSAGTIAPAAAASAAASERAAAERLLLGCLSRVGARDEVHAVAAAFAGPACRLQLARQRGDWARVLEAQDARLQQQRQGCQESGAAVPLLRALINLGCHHTAQRYAFGGGGGVGMVGATVTPAPSAAASSSLGCPMTTDQRALRDAQCELAWRLADWDDGLLARCARATGPDGALSLEPLLPPSRAGAAATPDAAAPATPLAALGLDAGAILSGCGGGFGFGFGGSDDGAETFNVGVLRALDALCRGEADAFGAALQAGAHGCVRALVAAAGGGAGAATAAASSSSSGLSLGAAAAGKQLVRMQMLESLHAAWRLAWGPPDDDSGASAASAASPPPPAGALAAELLLNPPLGARPAANPADAFTTRIHPPLDVVDAYRRRCCGPEAAGAAGGGGAAGFAAAAEPLVELHACLCRALGRDDALAEVLQAKLAAARRCGAYAAADSALSRLRALLRGRQRVRLQRQEQEQRWASQATQQQKAQRGGLLAALAAPSAAAAAPRVPPALLLQQPASAAQQQESDADDWVARMSAPGAPWFAESAKLLWAQGQHVMAVRAAGALVDALRCGGGGVGATAAGRPSSSSSSPELTAQHQGRLAAALGLLGKWRARSRYEPGAGDVTSALEQAAAAANAAAAAAAAAAATSAFSTHAHEDAARRARLAARAHRRLAAFADARYRAASAQWRSETWRARRAVMAEKRRHIETLRQREQEPEHDDRMRRYIRAHLQRFEKPYSVDLAAAAALREERDAGLRVALRGYAAALEYGGGSGGGNGDSSGAAHDQRIASRLCQLWFEHCTGGGGDAGSQEDADLDAELDEAAAAAAAAAGAAGVGSGSAGGGRASSAGAHFASAGGAAAAFPGVDVNAEVAAALQRAPSYKFVPLVYQMASRLAPEEEEDADDDAAARTSSRGGGNRGSRGRNSPHPAFQRALHDALARLAADHPLHTFYVLVALRNGNLNSSGKPFSHNAIMADAHDAAKVRAAATLLERVVADARAKASDAQRRRQRQEQQQQAAAARPSSSSPAADDPALLARLCQRPELLRHMDELSRVYVELAAAPWPQRPAPPVQQQQGQPTKMENLTEMAFPAALRRRARALHLAPVVTLQLPPDPSGAYERVPAVRGFAPRVRSAGGINQPKVVACFCSDGASRRQLVKSGSDDMRQDAVMQQFFETVNGVLALACAKGGGGGGGGGGSSAAAATTPTTLQQQQPPLRVSTYRVVPFSPSAGVVEWVENTVPMVDVLAGPSRRGGAIVRYAHHCGGVAGSAGGGGGGSGGNNNHNFRGPPGPWDFVQAHNFLKASEPHDLRARFDECCAKVPRALHHFFLEAFRRPGDWFAARAEYSRCTAAASVCGYVVGLGDRHLGNVLLDVRTARIVHIDLGVAFEAGRFLHLPETIPFRLTGNVVDGFGPAGVEGAFRRGACETLRALRREREALLTVVEVVLHDPMARWRITPIRAEQRQRREEEADVGPPLPTAGAGTAGGRRASRRATARTTTTDGGGDETAEDERPGMAAAPIGNADAARAVLRVRQKLEGLDEDLGLAGGDDGGGWGGGGGKGGGRDGGDGDGGGSGGGQGALSVDAQLQALVAQARDPDRLCSLFIGWAPYL
jgi:hypothetical protein